MMTFPRHEFITSPSWKSIDHITISLPRKSECSAPHKGSRCDSRSSHCLFPWWVAPDPWTKRVTLGTSLELSFRWYLLISLFKELPTINSNWLSIGYNFKQSRMVFRLPYGAKWMVPLILIVHWHHFVEGHLLEKQTLIMSTSLFAHGKTTIKNVQYHAQRITKKCSHSVERILPFDIQMRRI